MVKNIKKKLFLIVMIALLALLSWIFVRAAKDCGYKRGQIRFHWDG